MPLDLNKIALENWRNDPNVAVEIAKKIQTTSWAESPFEALLGKGYDRGLKAHIIEGMNPFRPRLRPKLTGDGVEGNADFETNLDNFEILSQTMFPKLFGNSVKSEVKQYQSLKEIDFLHEATESLKTWVRESRDNHIATALFNDCTNVVVCDVANGFKDTTTKASVQGCTRELVKGDVCNVKAIKRAIFMARTGERFNGQKAFPIKPLRAERKNNNGLQARIYNYAILLDSYAAAQLREDFEWKELQKMDKRGELNNLFTGFLGVIDGCPVIEIGNWSLTQSGLVSSEVSDEKYRRNICLENHKKITPPSYYNDTTPYGMGFLVGACGLIVGGSKTPKFYIDDKQDAGRKTMCGIDNILSVAKGRFEATQGTPNIYADTDFAVIGIAHSKE